MKTGTLNKIWAPILACIIFLAFDAQAKVYKCVDPEGNVEYSQIPCSGDTQSQKVYTSSSNKVAQETCSAVKEFAVDLASNMRSGTPVEEEIDQHGGINGITKAALNVINYVYSFRVNKSTSDVRIGSLVYARCQNGAFGKVEYVDLPKKYDPTAEEETDENAEVDKSESSKQNIPAEKPTPSKPLDVSSDEMMLKAECQQLRSQIDGIDKKMRSAYSNEEGDEYRKQRWDLRREIRSKCK